MSEINTGYKEPELVTCAAYSYAALQDWFGGGAAGVWLGRQHHIEVSAYREQVWQEGAPPVSLPSCHSWYCPLSAHLMRLPYVFSACDTHSQSQTTLQQEQYLRAAHTTFLYPQTCECSHQPWTPTNMARSHHQDAIPDQT